MFFYFEGLKIFYRDVKPKNASDGEIPILFLHGWGGNGESFKCFEEDLKKSVRCIYIDFPPFGKSSKLICPYDVEKYSQIILSLVKKLGIDRVNIVAHSFGGRVALFLASKYSNIINKMLLTGCAGIKRREFKIRAKVFGYKFKKFLCKIKVFSKQKLVGCGSEDYKNLDDIMKKTFNNIVNFDERKLLKDIRCETLFVWGKMDKETPFYFTKIFKKHIKNSEVIVFDNLGHFAYLEASKTFLKILESYFGV